MDSTTIISKAVTDRHKRASAVCTAATYRPPIRKQHGFQRKTAPFQNPSIQEKCLWAAKNVRQCEKSGKACKCAQRDAPAGFLSGFFHDYSSYSLSGGSSRPGPWMKHLLKSGGERKCKKRLNEGVFDRLPFAHCIGIRKNKALEAGCRQSHFHPSPQFEPKCNRFMKVSHKRLLKTASTGTLRSNFRGQTVAP